MDKNVFWNIEKCSVHPKITVIMWKTFPLTVSKRKRESLSKVEELAAQSSRRTPDVTARRVEGTSRWVWRGCDARAWGTGSARRARMRLVSWRPETGFAGSVARPPSADSAPLVGVCTVRCTGSLSAEPQGLEKEPIQWPVAGGPRNVSILRSWQNRTVINPCRL